MSGGEPEQAAAERARLAALRLLDRRRYGTAELLAKLDAQGFVKEAALAACDRLTEAGLLDDAALAAAFVRDGSELRGWGRLRLRRALLARSLPLELVEQALAAHYDRAGEQARALELARARLARLGGVDVETARRRLAGYLARRGLDAHTVWAVLAELLPRGARGGESEPLD